MRARAREVVTLFLAAVLFALSLNVFLSPSQIVAGGFSGIAIILNILFDFPVGISVILLNIPFLIANARVQKKGYIRRAFIGVLLTGLTSQALSGVGSITQDRVVNALIGGVLMGISLGLIFSLGYTTGGTDLAATLIRVRFDRLKLGTALFICDSVVIITALIVTRDVYGVALALASIYVQTLIIDAVMLKLKASH